MSLSVKKSKPKQHSTTKIIFTLKIYNLTLKRKKLERSGMRIETDHSEVQMAEMDTKDGMDQGGDHAARADIEDHVINRAAVVVTQDRADDRNIDAKATGVDPNSKYKKTNHR